MLSILTMTNLFNLGVNKVFHLWDIVRPNPKKLLFKDLHVCKWTLIHDVDSKVVFDEHFLMCLIYFDMINPVEIFHGCSGDLFFLWFIPVMLHEVRLDLRWLPIGRMEPWEHWAGWQVLVMEMAVQPNLLQVDQAYVLHVLQSLGIHNLVGVVSLLVYFHWALSGVGYAVAAILVETWLLVDWVGINHCLLSFVSVTKDHVEGVYKLRVGLLGWDQWIYDVTKHTLTSPKFSQVYVQTLLYRSEIIEWVENFGFGITTVHIA